VVYIVGAEDRQLIVTNVCHVDSDMDLHFVLYPLKVLGSFKEEIFMHRCVHMTICLPALYFLTNRKF
jgi:hypothetical protein